MNPLLYEAEMRNSERQVSGQKNEPGVQSNTAGSLANHNKINNTTASATKGRNDNSQAPIVLPYPMDRLDEIMSDLFLATVNAKKIIENTKGNPALKEKFIPFLDAIVKKLEAINNISVEISNIEERMKQASLDSEIEVEK